MLQESDNNVKPTQNAFGIEFEFKYFSDIALQVVYLKKAICRFDNAC